MAKQGVGALDTISGDDVAKLPPLPYHHTPLSKAYAERLQMVGLRSKNVVAAQCLWDAAMAHSRASTSSRRTRATRSCWCVAPSTCSTSGVVDHVEKYTESGGPFEPLERDEFRVVVCVPMDGPSFLGRSLRGRGGRPVFRHGRGLHRLHQRRPRRGRASAPLRRRGLSFPMYAVDSDARHTPAGTGRGT